MEKYELEKKLYNAIKRNNLAQVKELAKQVAESGDINANVGRYGETCLIEAAACGNTEIMEVLIDIGADLNAKDTRYGETAIVKAGMKKHMDALQLLVKRGVNVNIRDFYGNTPIILIAPFHNNYDEISFLRENGADLNAKNNNGETAVMQTAFRDCEINYDYLVRNGADLFLKDDHGNDAEDWARIGKNYNLVSTIQRHKDQFIDSKQKI